MEQQQTNATTNMAVGGPVQLESNLAQKSSENEAKLSLLKPELLCVGFIGFFHNLSVLIFVLYFFIWWSRELHYKISCDKEDNYTPENVNCYVRKKDIVGHLFLVGAAHLVGILFSVGVLVMDVFLRGSAYPDKNRDQASRTLHSYLILNVTFLAFGFISSYYAWFYGEKYYLWQLQFCWVLSHCLRAACCIIVFKYRTLLGQWPGFYLYLFRLPTRVHNQSPAQAQAVPSNQGQKV